MPKLTFFFKDRKLNLIEHEGEIDHEKIIGVIYRYSCCLDHRRSIDDRMRKAA